MNDPYTEIATELRGVADAFDGLAGRDLPAPGVNLSVQPARHRDPDEQKTAVVDVVATALLGGPGQPEEASSGSWLHKAVTEHPSGLRVVVMCSIDSLAERDLRAENERLRALLAERDSRGGDDG